MATADQIKALIRSHAEGDERRFFSIALQVAAHEARTGRSRFARELRDIIDHAQATPRPAARSDKPVPLVQPRGELAGLLAADYPETRLGDMVLDDTIRGRLERVIAEHRQRERLAAFGSTSSEGDAGARDSAVSRAYRSAGAAEPASPPARSTRRSPEATADGSGVRVHVHRG